MDVITNIGFLEEKNDNISIAESLKKDGVIGLQVRLLHHSREYYNFVRKTLETIKEKTNLEIYANLENESQLSNLSDYIDVLKIRGIHMYDYNYLKMVGMLGKRTILERKDSCDYIDWYFAAHVLEGFTGKGNVRLSEPWKSENNSIDIVAPYQMLNDYNYKTILDLNGCQGYDLIKTVKEAKNFKTDAIIINHNSIDDILMKEKPKVKQL